MHSVPARIRTVEQCRCPMQPQDSSTFVPPVTALAVPGASQLTEMTGDGEHRGYVVSKFEKYVDRLPPVVNGHLLR